MANPFEKRATEYLREDEAGFLSLVSPEPLRTYLETAAERGQLYDMLVRIIGTPGSGKTTMATLLEARMVETALAEREKEEHREIIRALEEAGFELFVPLGISASPSWWSRARKPHGAPEGSFSVAGPIVRIHLPPAASR